MDLKQDPLILCTAGHSFNVRLRGGKKVESQEAVTESTGVRKSPCHNSDLV